MYGKGYGMPSSHAQFVSYFSVSLALFLLVRHQPHPARTHTPMPLWQRLLLSSLAIVGAGTVAQSRIYLNYHTPKQVWVGCAAGAVCAVAWFVVVAVLRQMGWVEWALESDVTRMFRMRDLVVTEDLPDAGWARWEERRLKMYQGKKRR